MNKKTVALLIVIILITVITVLFIYFGNQFFVYAEGFRGGVNIEIGNVNKSSITPEIATVPASSGGAHVRLFDYTGRPIDSFQTFETWWRGGYNLAAGDGLLSIVSLQSSRRTSIRTIVD